jgi:hypothetical protein
VQTSPDIEHDVPSADVDDGQELRIASAFGESGDASLTIASATSAPTETSVEPSCGATALEHESVRAAMKPITAFFDKRMRAVIPRY